MKQKFLKKVIVISLSFLMVIAILPCNSASAATNQIVKSPSYQFQDTDGLWDVVRCTIVLAQDYSENSTMFTFNQRRVSFIIEEIGCGGVNYFVSSSPCYKSSGNVIRTFTDWQFMPGIIPAECRVMTSQLSNETVYYYKSYISNVDFTFDYTIGGTNFYIIPFPMCNGSVTIHLM